MKGSLRLRNYRRVHMRSVRAPGWRAARFYCPPNTDPVRRSAFPALCDLVSRKGVQDFAMLANTGLFVCCSFCDGYSLFGLIQAPMSCNGC